MRKLLLTLAVLFTPFMAHPSAFMVTQIISACDMSGASCISSGIDLQQIGTLSLQAVYTGAPVGTLKVQVSADNVQPSQTANPTANVVNWTDYTGSSVAISAAGNTLYNMTFAGYRWARLVYTKTSGTGTINATANGKGIN